jgi:cyclopropane-fatty-acyl-phospholipid synthase
VSSASTHDIRSAVARRLLERVFASAGTPIAFRLWDGTSVRPSGADGGFTIVVRSPAVLRRILRRPSPLCFGEAFIGGDLDIEGDIFAAMRAATIIEKMSVPLATKLRVLAGTVRL